MKPLHQHLEDPYMNDNIDPGNNPWAFIGFVLVVLIIVTIVISVASCTPRLVTNKTIYASLVSAKSLGGGRWHLRLTAPGMDTIHYDDYEVGTRRNFYHTGDIYKLQYDSTQCRPCDSAKLIKSTYIKLKQ